MLEDLDNIEDLDNDDFDELIIYCDGHKQHKARKNEIDKELMPVASRLLKWWV